MMNDPKIETGALQRPSPALVQQAAACLAQNPGQAEELARSILSEVPDDPRALLILASARRRQGDPAAAYRLLAPLAKSFPKAANTHYELGASLADLGDTREAIAMLRRAVDLNRDLPEAWRALGDQLFRAGDTSAAEAAYAQNLRASVRNPALKGAAQALSARQLRDAEAALRAYLIARPNDLEGLRLMGETLLGLERYGDAEVVLAHCLELDPGQDGARFSYANALFRQQKATEATRQAEHLLRQRSDDPAYRNLLAACLGLVAEDGRVGEIYAGLAAEYPKQPRIWLNYGHALRTIGQSDEAILAYRRSVALAPGLGEAYWSLANLKSAAFTPTEEATMLAEVARTDLVPDDRLHLHYALGKAREDAKDYAAAFEHYRQGAEMPRASLAYDANETTALVRRSVAVFTPEFFSERRAGGARSTAPIFIVGLPRSGSTLIEQILASHPAVEGTRELPDIGFIARQLGWMASASPDGAYPARLKSLDQESLSALGRSFLENTRIHRKLGRPFFIDKMPNNFLHIGLIQSILPEAKIIDARRHPLAACFSAFKQHFAQGQAFSYDLTDLGRYYRDYVDLLAHFDRVLPGRVCRVIYEDMVEDTETEVRRLLDYCGLEFEQSCLRFFENDRPVRTVSSEQVRQPIYRAGLEQWKSYEPWLAPLKEALGPALGTWRG